ncbi:hypothetical protein NEMIN01_0217 [Nematocida minor]|uniref:uncharacterized protein n=1 Tax=Nematocida minor TaxID=1912983 RepID=UPI00221F7194|nr:uncharacterized protein NEMIN01_0113 [Nematocida minor]XP_051332119.1 uncharacterized protein NEMIN01_0217 [Nematocida minor]KAI5188849.1 hypothetical protein NEMIN01_0113 [Nematocida minor]KAI5188953.1 hypothetical protein NEMIN01_0217 [Nematocida minor]
MSALTRTILSIILIITVQESNEAANPQLCNLNAENSQPPLHGNQDEIVSFIYEANEKNNKKLNDTSFNENQNEHTLIDPIVSIFFDALLIESQFDNVLMNSSLDTFSGVILLKNKEDSDSKENEMLFKHNNISNECKPCYITCKVFPDYCYSKNPLKRSCILLVNFNLKEEKEFHKEALMYMAMYPHPNTKFFGWYRPLVVTTEKNAMGEEIIVIKYIMNDNSKSIAKMGFIKNNILPYQLIYTVGGGCLPMSYVNANRFTWLPIHYTPENKYALSNLIRSHQMKALKSSRKLYVASIIRNGNGMHFINEIDAASVHSYYNRIYNILTHSDNKSIVISIKLSDESFRMVLLSYIYLEKFIANSWFDHLQKYKPVPLVTNRNYSNENDEKIKCTGILFMKSSRLENQGEITVDLNMLEESLDLYRNTLLIWKDTFNENIAWIRFNKNLMTENMISHIERKYYASELELIQCKNLFKIDERMYYENIILISYNIKEFSFKDLLGSIFSDTGCE